MNDKPGIPYGFTSLSGTFPTYTDNRHLLTFGPTRSGKNATTITQVLLQVPHSVICIDPKGQNAAITARCRRDKLGQDVFAINPFGMHVGPPWRLPRSRFNPLAHLRLDDPNVIAEVGSIAEALIIPESKDPFFTDGSRDIVKAIILHVLETEPDQANLGRVYELLTLPRAHEPEADIFLHELLRPMLISTFPIVRWTAPRFLDNNRTTQSVLATAATQLSFLADPVLTDPDTGTLTGSDFTMLDLKRRPVTVYLVLPGRYMDAYARLFRLMVTVAIDQLTSEPGGHPVLMVLDEFATLQNLGAISKAFGFAAGFNLQCWAFLQDLPQLKAIYGDGKWESFLANAGLIQFFTPADMTTANYLAERGGKEWVENQSLTHGEISRKQQKEGFTGTQTSVNLVHLPVLPPEKTMSLEPTKQIVFYGGLHGYREVERWPYWRINRLNGLYDPDPYHR